MPCRIILLPEGFAGSAEDVDVDVAAGDSLLDRVGVGATAAQPFATRLPPSSSLLLSPLLDFGFGRSPYKENDIS